MINYFNINNKISKIKNRLSKYKKVSKNNINRLFHDHFNEEDFKKLFTTLDIKKGDKIFLHSGVSSICNLKPKTVNTIDFLNSIITFILDWLGDEGALIMPSFAINTTSIKYWESDPVFDLKNTPGANGLFSEVFRKYPNTLRSTHPSEAIIAQGNIPKKLLEDHYKQAINPASSKTPYAWLLLNGGVIIHFGIPYYKSISLIHFIDSYLNMKQDFNYLLPEIKTATLITNNNVKLCVRARPYNSHLTKLYNRKQLYKCMGKKNLITTHHKGIPFSSLKAKPAFENAIKVGLNSLSRGYLPPWYAKDTKLHKWHTIRA